MQCCSVSLVYAGLVSVNLSFFSVCLQLFNVWVEPLVEVVVHLSDQKDAVILEVSMIPV